MCVILRTDCEYLISNTVERFGWLNGFVANAGVGAYGKLINLPLEQIDNMLDFNARGTVYSVRAALRVPLENWGGDVVIVGSVTGLKGLPNESICVPIHEDICADVPCHLS
jgi:NADP-dependent 3-hydroxy acid dehydrogenase YdfG